MIKLSWIVKKKNEKQLLTFDSGDEWKVDNKSYCCNGDSRPKRDTGLIETNDVKTTKKYEWIMQIGKQCSV